HGQICHSGLPGRGWAVGFDGPWRRLTEVGAGSDVVRSPLSPETADARRGVEITAAGLVKAVKDGRRVLSDISLRVRPGELLAIVGGSGAGKTTLLEVLAGIHPASEGEVSFDGVDLYGYLDAFRGRLGFVLLEDLLLAGLP